MLSSRPSRRCRISRKSMALFIATSNPRTYCSTKKETSSCAISASAVDWSIRRQKLVRLAVQDIWRWVAFCFSNDSVYYFFVGFQPERIDLEKSEYDIRADVWSLGITLVELATGSHPYKNCHTDFEMLTQVLGSDPPSLPTDCGFTLEFQQFVAKWFVHELLVIV